MKGSKKPALTLDANLVQDDIPLLVIPKIYLGSIHAAFNLDELTAAGITHILNASRIPVTFPGQFTYLSVEIRDKDESNILACIPTTNIFIEAGLDDGGILVHCFGGKSRSPAFIAAYLMSSRSWTFDEAYNVIKAARPAVEINLGFECQLRAYHAGNFDVYLAQQLLLRTRIRELHYLKETTPMNEAKEGSPNPSGNQEFHEFIAAHILQQSHGNPSSGGNGGKLSMIHDSFTYAPRDAQGNVVSGGAAVVNPHHRHKRSFSDAKEMGLDAPNSTISPSIPGEDDMEVVTDVEESTSSFRSPPSKSNASSHHSNFSNFTGKTSIETFGEESMDSALTAMSTDLVNSRPSSSGSHMRRPLLTVVNPSLAPSVPSLSRHNTSSFHNNSFHIPSSTRRSKQPRSIRSVAATASTVGSLPQSVTPELMKNPQCHLSRRGSKWVRVIPPLRGLEREFKCSWCNLTLFQLVNVLRIDLEVQDMLEKFYDSLSKMSNTNTSSHSEGFGAQEDEFTAQFMQEAKTMRGNHQKQPSFKFYDQQKMTDNAHEIMLSPRSTQPMATSSSSSSSSAPSSLPYKPNTLLPPLGATKAHPSNKSSSKLQDPPEHLKSSPRMRAEEAMDVEEQEDSRRFETKSQHSQSNTSLSHHNSRHQNTVHFSSSAKHNQSSNAFSFDDFPMPLSTSKASMSKNKGFNFDGFDDSPPPQTNHPSTSMFPSVNLGVAARSDSSSDHYLSQSSHSHNTNSNQIPTSNGSGNTPGSSNNTPRLLLPPPHHHQNQSNNSNSSNNSGATTQLTPRRLPSLDQTFTSQSMDSPRLTHSPAPMLKRQSSLGNSSGAFPQPSSSSLSKMPLMTLPSKKNLLPLPSTTSLGPPYPSTITGYDESPRLMIPPHRQQQILQQQGVVNSTDYAQLVSSNANIFNHVVDRPKSAEKRRWLARVNLLNENHASKIQNLAEADDTASQLALNGGKYYYIEYLEWMGKALFCAENNTGDIVCPGCKNAVGDWTWTPSHRLLLNGRLEAPLFRIHKHVVHHTDFDFDATPSSTPRPPEENNNPV